MINPAQENTPQTCKTCGTTLVVRQTKNSPLRQQKQYYYTAYYFCPKCRKMYLSETFKVENAPQKTSLFAENDNVADAEIWTDGAARNNGRPDAKAAWAFVSGKHEEAGLVEGEKQTNNVAEGLAIYHALEWAGRSGHKKIRLHTDSQISIYNLAKPVEKIAVNRGIFSEIRDIIKKYALEVRFAKVLGHSGDPNNERADKLANTLAGISK